MASLWRPGGPWDALGTLGSRTEDTLRYMLGFFTIFTRFWDPILKAVCVRTKNVFVHACFQVFFVINFGSASGCLGLENQAFDKEGIAKKDFRRNWFSHVHF